MFNLDALDKLIAVVVVLLVLSLIVQSIQAAIKKFFRIKSLQLEQSLIHLFYYLLDKDAIKAMQSVADRTPMLRSFFSWPIIRNLRPDHPKSIEARDPQVEALYEAVTREFARAGRVSPGGKMLIESLSKNELINFIGQIRVNDLIKGVTLPEVENLSGIRNEIAEARKAVRQIFVEHGAVIERTPLAEIREPLIKLFSQIDLALDLKNNDLTLGDLSASALDAARKMIDELPDSIEETLLHLKDGTFYETARRARLGAARRGTPQLKEGALDAAAQALRTLQGTLAPLSDKLKAVIAIPHKLSQLSGKVELWYDTIMRSFEERYTRSMKSFTLAISFAVVALLNANIFDIYRELSSNEAKRDMIVQSGERLTAMLAQQPAADREQVKQSFNEWSKESYKEIDKKMSLYTALGFKGPQWILDIRQNAGQANARDVIETIIGWAVMTMLLSVGAPFWQDTLESLFGLKNLLRKKDHAEGQANQ